jgi:hypothetical protein
MSQQRRVPFITTTDIERFHAIKVNPATPEQLLIPGSHSASNLIDALTHLVQDIMPAVTVSPVYGTEHLTEQYKTTEEAIHNGAKEIGEQLQTLGGYIMYVHSFPKRIEYLVKFIGGNYIHTPLRQPLCDAISKELGLTLTLRDFTIPDARAATGEVLGQAITAKYPDGPMAMEKFIKAVRIKMDGNDVLSECQGITLRGDLEETPPPTKASVKELLTKIRAIHNPDHPRGQYAKHVIDIWEEALGLTHVASSSPGFRKGIRIE